jgi:hypothetical protein
VLVTSTSSSTYTASLVGADGRVAAAVQASSPPPVTCGAAAAGLVPLPVSTSDSKLYFMDASGSVRTLSPGGTASSVVVIRLPTPTTVRRSIFAVSPDGTRMAVSIVAFGVGGASTTVLLDDLAVGPSQNPIFTQTGPDTLWPIGWHGGNVVLAKVPACTQGGGPTCCGPQELHLVVPSTAVRLFTIGGPTCVVPGSPSPAGVICENSAFTTATVLDWNGAAARTIAIPGPVGAELSPGGERVALVDSSGTTFAGLNLTLRGLLACGWIDEAHVLAGGDAQSQPRVGELPSGIQVPVAAQGDCAGRIPGGL